MTEPTTTPTDGRRDLDAAIRELVGRIPEPLAPLATLAYNYRWAWLPGGPELFAAVDPGRFELTGRNPVRLLQESSSATLATAAADETIVARARELVAQLQADLVRPVADVAVSADRPVGFICAEYGVHVSLPVYSGGLGALAGDLLKEASDRALPMVAVGLMYRRGYFRQRVDSSGWQHEYWLETDPDRLPAALVHRDDGTPLTIQVAIRDSDVTARVWRVDVGRVPLYLLDTECPENDPLDRWITGRLYVGDPETRLAQYTLLGVGGIRVLRAMGYEPGVIHLNEGHAALAPLELERRSGDESLEDALTRARARTVFTTHTPVPAGNDTYESGQIEEILGGLAREWGTPVEQLLALGHDPGAEPDAPFGVTQAALRASRSAGGVSRRHGKVARAMWHKLWPDRELHEVPIGYVTNGVHVPTWMGTPIRELLDRHLPEGWSRRASDPEVWAHVQRIPPAELWQARTAQRSELVEYVRARSVSDRLARDDSREYVGLAAGAFDPNVLTIGFARRVATYKRLDLLTRNPEETLRLLAGDRPAQVVLAGKAHPRDDDAKRALQQLFGLKTARVIGERVVFLDDYDLYSASCLVRGCDVWMNVPRPPLEASGTSGMKSVFNGGLQLSVLDGWWAEGYESGNGWAIAGEIDPDEDAQDERHAVSLFRLLEHEVVPAFYERDEQGLPQRWLELILHSLRTLGPRFSATRMLAEYVAGPYSG